MGIIEYQPHQIVSLSCGDRLLYAEVIQMVSDRGLCWARPLAMIVDRSDKPQQFSNLDSNLDSNEESEQQADLLLDLRQASDLLLPLAWFQIALDTEVLPVLTRLSQVKSESALPFLEAESLGRRSSAQESLQQFVRALCQKKQQSHEPLF